MLETILKNDIETDTGIDTFLEVPEAMPDEFIVIDRMSEKDPDHIYSGSFVIYCFAKSLYRAATIADLVKSAVNETVLSEPTVAKVSLESNGSDNSHTIGRYCYRLMFDFIYY